MIKIIYFVCDFLTVAFDKMSMKSGFLSITKMETNKYENMLFYEDVIHFVEILRQMECIIKIRSSLRI